MGLLLLAGCSGGAEPGPARTVGVPGSWHPVFTDQFSGSTLNQRVWQPSRYGGHTGDAPFNPEKEDAWFSPHNVRVRDGNLVFTVAHQPRRVDGRSYPYSSGVVQTRHAVLRPDSYIEARIQIPRCDGCWPAFWAVPPASWPPEIDVMEFFNAGSDSQPSFNYITTGGQTGPSQYGAHRIDYRTGYHVYGLLWSGGRLIPYVDGHPYPGVAAAGNLPTHGLTVIMNLSIRSGTAPPRGTQMRVDWIRVWAPG